MLKVQVYASEKVRPAFQLLARLQPVEIDFTDWSTSPAGLVRNIASMAHSDVVYLHSPTNLRIMILPIAHLLRKPVMLQWVGTDVLTVAWQHYSPFWDIGAEQEMAVEEILTRGLTGVSRWLVPATMQNSDRFVAFLNRFVTHHVACAPHLVQELEKVSIHASYLPVLNHIETEVLPFPDDFAVLSYIYPKRDVRAFYGWKSLVRLAHDYPDLTIFVVGRDLSPANFPANIIPLGYVNDIRQILSKVKAVLRLTYHDGMPRLVLEGLATGRYVIYTQTLPHTFHVSNYEEVTASLDTIRNTDAPNLNGLEYINQSFTPQKIAEMFARQFQVTKEKQRSP